MNLNISEITYLMTQAFIKGEQFGDSWECSGMFCDNPNECAMHGPENVRENIIEKLIKELT